MRRWGLPSSETAGCGFGLEDQGLWKTGDDGWLLPGLLTDGPGLSFGTRSGCDLGQSRGLLLALQSRSSRFSVLWDFFCSFP